MDSQTALNDDDLVVAAQGAIRGDTRAFDQLVERHRRRTMANCRYLTGSPDEAEDLAQEVFVKVFFGLRRFEARAAFGTWLQRIKINHCLNFLRAQRGHTFVDVEDPALEGLPELQVRPTAEARLHASDERRVIEAVLDSLPGTLRVPLIMRDLDGLAYDEIAALLHLKLSAVKMRIKRARDQFRARYAELSADLAPGQAEDS
jgi:RNA polymerase sigma-70 factor (ECF subfamily)